MKIKILLRAKVLSFFLMMIFLALLTNQANAQNGYIYLHHQAANEEGSPNFTFNVTGGSLNQN